MSKNKPHEYQLLIKTQYSKARTEAFEKLLLHLMTALQNAGDEIDPKTPLEIGGLKDGKFQMIKPKEKKLKIYK